MSTIENIRRWMSRKPLEIEAWFQRTTNRKWHMGSQIVTWPMTSRDPRRCCEAVRSAIIATAWLLVYKTYSQLFNWCVWINKPTYERQHLNVTCLVEDFKSHEIQWNFYFGCTTCIERTTNTKCVPSFTTVCVIKSPFNALIDDDVRSVCLSVRWLARCEL